MCGVVCVCEGAGRQVGAHPDAGIGAGVIAVAPSEPECSSETLDRLATAGGGWAAAPIRADEMIVVRSQFLFFLPLVMVDPRSFLQAFCRPEHGPMFRSTHSIGISGSTIRRHNRQRR